MKELLISLDNRASKPMYEQIYSFVRNEIQEGKILAGEQLPSSRALSKQLSVSRSTVDLAYEQLSAEGYLESIPCKGYFVSDVSVLYQLKDIKETGKSSGVQKRQEYLYDFHVGGIDENGFPLSEWRKISKTVLAQEDPNLFLIGDAKGELGLREAIGNYLHHARGVNCTPEQIIVGAGNDFLLMLLSTILGKDKTIAMESPTYISAYNCFKNLGYELKEISLDESGMRPDELIESKADIAYVMPSHQFPMGMIMPIRRRMQLLAWANEGENRYLIEDDYDSEFRFKGKPVPSLQGVDQNGKVIYLGTFSKAIAPAIRISYMVLPDRVLQAYEERGRCFSSTVSKMDQKILETYLREGYFERHLNRMRGVYKGKNESMMRELRQMQDIVEVKGENAGLHVLLELKNGLNEKEAVHRAAKEGIHVHGLSEYDVRGSKEESKTVILGYGGMQEEDIPKVLNILCRAWTVQ